MYYLVLGEKAESFYDPLSRTAVDKGRVTEVEALPTNSIFNRALRGQHIRLLSEVELKVHLAATKVEEEKVDSVPFTAENLPTAEDLDKATKADIISLFHYFDKEDQELLKDLKKAELIETCLEIAEDYFPEETE